MERRAFTIHGLVQGVGFRPFIHGLATRFRLNGSVQNRLGSVFVEVEGKPSAIRRFSEELQRQAPPLSRIDAIQCILLPIRNEKGFHIKPSEKGNSGQVSISPDVAVCEACLAELFDPADPRYRYPFINCTHCGPRLTIIQGAPYDRERTTMASFSMCSRCRAEYADPGNRRFHAQPIACPECGPQLEVLDPNGERILTNDPLAVFVAFLGRGKLGALKGLGGFHLVCHAGDERAVRELRRRKHREEKPFAVMVKDAEAAQRFCEIAPPERRLLESQRRPIVLLRKRRQPSSLDPIADSVAPGNPYLGVLLPYTPLHHLLMEAVHGWPLVMTSGNQSDEPIAYQDADAVDRLGQIADVFLTHNRPIHVRCDDSVTRIVASQEQPLRRSRGHAPESIKLLLECVVPTLAVGGQLKTVFSLGRGFQAFLSHHLGDLDDYASFAAFERDIRLYEELFDVRPEWIVHDLHPDYSSTHYAERRAAEERIALFAVQHHHAHMASCMAEYGLNEPVIGVIFDGTGFGLDQTIWGGEFLVGDYGQFTRAAHFRSVRLPGGEQAIRDPWRIAASHLIDADCPLTSLQEISAQERQTVKYMIHRGFNSPWTTSAGRLFDAVASLAGVRSRVSYEGQAAQELEWLATNGADSGSYPFELTEQDGDALTWNRPSLQGSLGEDNSPSMLTSISIDTRPLIRAVVEDRNRDVSREVMARQFHSTMVEIISAVCHRIRSQTHLETVVFSGGVFQNSLLCRETEARLACEGFRVYQHRLVPANDGGLSLGQLAIASQFQRSIFKQTENPSLSVPSC